MRLLLFRPRITGRDVHLWIHFRQSIPVKTANGSRTVDLKFVDYDIVNGKPGISGLPASFAGEEEVQTLVVHMMDGGCGIDVDLIYSVFEDEDVITRSVSVKNAGDRNIRLTKVYSACIDMAHGLGRDRSRDAR